MHLLLVVLPRFSPRIPAPFRSPSPRFPSPCTVTSSHSMDPLSIIASTIAITQALGFGIKTLQSLANSNVELCDMLNELSSLQKWLSQLDALDLSAVQSLSMDAIRRLENVKSSLQLLASDLDEVTKAFHSGQTTSLTVTGTSSTKIKISSLSGSETAAKSPGYGNARNNVARSWWQVLDFLGCLSSVLSPGAPDNPVPSLTRSRLYINRAISKIHSAVEYCATSRTPTRSFKTQSAHNTLFSTP